MGRDASLRAASALVHVRSRSVRGFPPSRRAWYPQARRTTSPRRSAGRLHTCRERGASREADRKVLQRSHGLRRCLPRAHDRNACRSHHPHYRPRFPSLPSPQPSSGSLCETRVILPPLISAETEPGLSALGGESNLRQWTAFCTKNATYMAKMEFNTGIETPSSAARLPSIRFRTEGLPPFHGQHVSKCRAFR